MTLLLLANLGGAGGSASAQPAVFGDLTTLFVDYVQDLRNAGTAMDVDTEVAADLATVRAAASGYLDDANTMYAAYLS